MESDKIKQRLERFESILLSIAILGTAWSAYQSACWRGIQTFRLTAAGVASRTALEKHLFTEQQFALDAMQVLHIVDQLVEGKSSIVEFYVKRIRPDLRAAVEAWLALKPLENPNAPPHPLVMPEYTDRVLGPARTEVQKLRAESDHEIALAEEANQTSDRYVLFTVLFASVLFFTGIAGKFDPGRTRIVLLSFAAVVLAVVVGLLLMTPVAGSYATANWTKMPLTH